MMRSDGADPAEPRREASAGDRAMAGSMRRHAASGSQPNGALRQPPSAATEPSAVWKLGGTRSRALLLCASLVAANVLAWVLTWIVCRGRPALFAPALLCYVLGARHALDADHIAAIDNVTRKLVNDGQRPVAVGFFFSLGHATVVALCTGLLTTAGPAARAVQYLSRIGGPIGGVISSALLIFLALVNMLALLSAIRRVAASRYRGSPGTPCSGHAPLAEVPPAGLLSRVLRPLLGGVRGSWSMFPIGVLFGLGFDTASEVALIALSSGHAAQLTSGAVLLLPLLFAAAMALVDTVESLVMVRTYAWSRTTVARRTRYDLSITLISVTAAIGVACLQIILQAPVSGRSALVRAAQWAELHASLLGTALTATLIVCWTFAAIFWREHRPTRL